MHRPLNGKPAGQNHAANTFDKVVNTVSTAQTMYGVHAAANPCNDPSLDQRGIATTLMSALLRFAIGWQGISSLLL